MGWLVGYLVEGYFGVDENKPIRIWMSFGGRFVWSVMSASAGYSVSGHGY